REAGDGTVPSLDEKRPARDVIAAKLKQPAFKDGSVAPLADLHLPITRAWQASLGDETLLPLSGHSTFTLDHVFLSRGDHTLTCRAAGTGKPVWERRLEGRATWIGMHGDLVIAAGPSTVSCLRAGDGTVSWHFDVTADPGSLRSPSPGDAEPLTDF